MSLFFVETWRHKDESTNKTQSYDRDMILEAKRAEVEEEIRIRVDAIMREELDILKVVRKMFVLKVSLFETVQRRRNDSVSRCEKSKCKFDDVPSLPCEAANFTAKNKKKNN